MRLLITASTKMIVRDRQNLFWALAFPVLFLGVFRLFSIGELSRTDLLLAVETPGPTSTALRDALDDASFLKVTLLEPFDEAEALRRLDDGDVDAVLLLHGGGETTQAELVHAIADPVGGALTVSGIEALVNEVNLGLMSSLRPIAFGARSTEDDDPTFFEFIAPGIIGLGLMTFSTIGLAGSLSRYREEGVLRRIRATPLAPWRFSASVLAAYMLVAVVQVLILVMIAELAGGDVLSGVVWLLPISLLGTWIFLNIAVIVAGTVQGRGAVESAANAITLPMMFLSGTFFPTDTLPSLVERIVLVLPLTHMLRALRGVTIDGETIVEQWPELVVMVGWAAVTMWLARMAFRFDQA
jgi:ABC-2 type transport system permease protein